MVLETRVTAPWTATATGRFRGTATSAVVVRHRRIRATSTRANGYWQTLYDSALVTLPSFRVHSVVHREVAADHIGSGRGSVSGKIVCFVFGICSVLAVVDADGADPTIP